ncbi:MAG: molybdenum cofactor guanylyltransferase [Thermodesulfobacteriota bacterium]
MATVSAIVLAGGKSRRMRGRNKALIDLAGRPLVERVVEVMRQIFREILLITNTPEEFEFLGVPMLPDLLPGRGSFGGLYTGLSASTSEHAFLVACDMPFLNAQVIRYLVAEVDRFDVVVPRVAGFLEPLHAVYSRACLPRIRDLLDRGELKIISLFPDVRVREVPESELRRFDEDLRCFMNINTPEDLAAALTTHETA